MKHSIPLLVFIPATFLVVACDHQDNVSTLPTGTVAFSGSGVTLTPGDGWKRIDIAAGPGQCPPTLVGKAGVLRVLVLPPDRSDPLAAAKALRAAFDSDPKSVKESFEQEPFTVAGGAQGIRVSYSEQSEKGGRVNESRSYYYMIRNREDRGVAVNYVATAERDSDEVHEMIRRTLRLQ